mmetsp:Transcript_55753/g.96780  ORF Transcript_55753/g.96780 Transcript_55753/m.96780 type:complete len:82 (-) Transcript_55753:3-248(-)
MTSMAVPMHRRYGDVTTRSVWQAEASMLFIQKVAKSLAWLIPNSVKSGSCESESRSPWRNTAKNMLQLDSTILEAFYGHFE